MLSAHSNIQFFWLPLGAILSAFRRWLSRVFGDILYPLLVELEIVTEESHSVVPCIVVSSTPWCRACISFYKQTKDVSSASTSEALNTAQVFRLPRQVKGLNKENRVCPSQCIASTHAKSCL